MMGDTLHVLDTDTCIYWLAGDQGVEQAALAIGVGHVATTVITECELFYGAHKSTHTKHNLAVLHELRQKVRTLQTTPAVGPLYGETKAALEKAGQRLDDADLLIAAITMVHEGVLVTNNTRHFERISGLRLENWVSSPRHP